MARVTLVQQIQSVELRQTVFQVVVSLTGPIASGGGGGGGPGGPVEWTAIQNKPTAFPPAPHNHAIADVAGLAAALDGKQGVLGFTPQNAAQKGVAGGYAELDGSGRVPAAQLPAWGNSDTIAEGTGNLYFTQPRVRATTLADYAAAGGRTALAAGDTVLGAFGKIGRWLSDLAAVAFSGSASDLTAGTLPAARFDDTAHGARAGGALHPAATGAVAGFMAAADKTKLDGVAPGATANATDAALRDRATHTGTQDAATITGSKTSSFISDFAAAVAALITGKQNTLVSGTNIRTVNGNSLLGSGDLVVGGGITDGDKGDITVSSTGAVWTIDAGAVSLSKMAGLATSTILGRATAGTGAPEALTAAQVRTILNVANGANNYSHPNHTGDVTSTGDGATVIAPVAIGGKPLVTAEGADHVLILDATDGALKKALVSGLGGGGSPTQSIIIAASDETTALTAGVGKVTFRMPYAFTLTGVRASLTAAQASGSILTVDINEGGASILSTKLTIDNGEKTSTTAATAAVISDTNLADDAEITIDIDQVGTGAAGLKVVLIGTKA